MRTLTRLAAACRGAAARPSATAWPSARARPGTSKRQSALAVASLSLAAVALTVAAPATQAAAAPAGASSAAASARPAAPSAAGGCYYKFVPPSTWIEVCQSGSGGGGSGGGSTSLVCTVHKLTPAEIQALGLPPAPKGQQWDFINCPSQQIPIGNVILASSTGGPPVTPQELLQIALGSITVPVLAPLTAPPLGRRALVGLPEWFWIPAADWQPVSVTVAVAGVWARVTATPGALTFDPGGGLAGAGCQGPGTSYSTGKGTQGACQYTYTVSSALQPGGAYQAAVTVTWQVAWTGSGGVGGTINAGLQMPYPFSLRVAEGQALVTGP